MNCIQALACLLLVIQPTLYPIRDKLFPSCRIIAIRAIKERTPPVITNWILMPQFNQWRRLFGTMSPALVMPTIKCRLALNWTVAL